MGVTSNKVFEKFTLMNGLNYLSITKISEKSFKILNIYSVILFRSRLIKSRLLKFVVNIFIR